MVPSYGSLLVLLVLCVGFGLLLGILIEMSLGVSLAAAVTAFGIFLSVRAFDE